MTGMMQADIGQAALKAGESAFSVGTTKWMLTGAYLISRIRYAVVQCGISHLQDKIHSAHD